MTLSENYTQFLFVTCGRGSIFFDSIAEIVCVLPVLWMTTCFTQWAVGCVACVYTMQSVVKLVQQQEVHELSRFRPNVGQ